MTAAYEGPADHDHRQTADRQGVGTTACRCDKVEHPTREAAEDAQKQLVYDNHVRGRDAESAGLNVYPCPDDPSVWHVGHSSLRTPTAYHYDLVSAFEDIEAANALRPAKPHILPTHLRRRHSGARLLLLNSVEERDPMTWSSWNANWDFRGIPHPGVFVPRSVDESASVRIQLGIIRLGVPASVVELRWLNYLQRNKTTRVMRNAVAELGNPAHWLATDRPVRCPFRSFDVWYRDRWVEIGALDDDFDAWLGQQKAK